MVYKETVSCNGVVLYESYLSVYGFQMFAVAGLIADCIVYVFGIKSYGDTIFG